MSLVTDPETIKELEALRGKPQPSQSTVSDANLIKELEGLRTKRELSKPVPEDVVEEVQEQGSTVGNLGRTALSIGTAIAAEPFAGLWGLMTFAGTGGDLRRTVREIEEARETLTYTPGTVGGQQNLQAVASVLAPLAEGLETISENSADLAFKYTGSPEAAGTAAAIPLVALELAGIKGVRSAGRGVKQISEADVRKAQKAMLTHPELKYNGSVAEVKLNNNGRLVEDKAGKALVKAGVRENDAAVITNSTKQTKKGMKDMIRLFEEAKGNDVIAMANKTTDPIGRAVTNRLQSLKTVRSGLGKRLDSIVQGDLGKTKVDITTSIAPINKMLNDAGIIGLNREFKNGQRVASRLDIPAYENFNTWIVSVHDGATGGGKALGYGQTAYLKSGESGPITFTSSAKTALNIAREKPVLDKKTGKTSPQSKSTFARIFGEWQNHDSRELYAQAQQIVSDIEAGKSDWVQAGMNPYRSSYFYDKATGQPIVEAQEVIQVGPLVLVKGAKKVSPDDARFRINPKDENSPTFSRGGLMAGEGYA